MLYEGATRVCALANWPGHIKSGIVVNEMIHVVDTYPTLAGLAGASTENSKALDGIDVWKTISEGASSPRNEIVYNIEPFRAAVRLNDWKLIWRPTLPSSHELYNITEDPSEKNDLSASNPEKVMEIKKRIEDLAKGSAKPLFMIDRFGALVKGMSGEPLLPMDEAYAEAQSED